MTIVSNRTEWQWEFLLSLSLRCFPPSSALILLIKFTCFSTMRLWCEGVEISSYIYILIPNISNAWIFFLLFNFAMYDYEIFFDVPKCSVNGEQATKSIFDEYLDNINFYEKIVKRRYFMMILSCLRRMKTFKLKLFPTQEITFPEIS